MTGDSPCINHCGRGSDLKLSNVLVASDSERVVREEVENGRTKVRLEVESLEGRTERTKSLR